MAPSTAETPEQAAALAPKTRGTRLDLEVFQSHVETKRPWITAVLPPGIDPDRWIDLALYAISRQPKLMLCTPDSLVRAMREGASLGLEIGNVLGQATLMPFWNSKRRAYEATFVPMYQGLLELAYRTGEVRDAEARVVFDVDEFAWEPASEVPIYHRPELTRPDTAKRVGAYFLAHLVNGGRVSEFMNAVEIEAIRQRAKAADDGPWVTDPDAMWRKTVTRRGIKYLPKSPELRRALSYEDIAESTASSPPAVKPSAGDDARTRLLDTIAAARQDGHGGESEATPTPDTTNTNMAAETAAREAEDDGS